MCMTMTERRQRTCALVLILALGVPVAPSAAAESGRHLGVASCASSLCHGSARPGTAYAVAQNEYVTWSHFDPHAGAYRALVDERGAAIAKRLGLPNAYEARVCLGCHADNVAREARGPRFQITDGVGCESCHGASENWIASHDDVPVVTHADNLRRGLRALEEPSVRVEVCLDCHVGSGDRFATHRMMAAGHPRLAFELETFTELWRTSGGREHYQVDADYLARKGAHPGGTDAKPVSSSATWSAGLFATAARKLDLLGGPQFAGSALVPEFALFNCYSCHRTMRLARWRDKGEVDLDPGNLKFDDGSLRMLEAVVASSGSPDRAAELHALIRTWQRSAGGDREHAAAATAELARWIGAERQRHVGRGLDTAQSRTALGLIAHAAEHGQFADYASAEQAAMGSVILLLESGGTVRRSPAVDDLFDALTDDDHYDAAHFRAILQRLGDRPAPAN
jgi:hypothetical protein